MQNILSIASLCFGLWKLFPFCTKSILILLICCDILKVLSRELRCTVSINLNWNCVELGALNALGNQSLVGLGCFYYYYTALFHAISPQSRKPWAVQSWFVWVTGLGQSWLDSGFRSCCMARVGGAGAGKGCPGRPVPQGLHCLHKRCYFYLYVCMRKRSCCPFSAVHSHLSNFCCS